MGHISWRLRILFNCVSKHTNCSFSITQFGRELIEFMWLFQVFELVIRAQVVDIVIKLMLFFALTILVSLMSVFKLFKIIIILLLKIHVVVFC
mmetsp:Transcript_32933/g.50360  ORF Transcript_32933/g.50360 Transcript_32933/m.50360 type:complete len:93 (-) Transcript_32933:313-591(-)